MSASPTYCTAAHVARYIKTQLSASDIEYIIEDVDADIERNFGPQDANDKFIRQLAALKTAYAIKISHDPQATIVGPFSIRHNPIEALQDKIREMENSFTRCELI